MDDYTIVFGDAVKALGDGKVGGYLIRFTNANDPDLTGDYFSQDTDFDTEFPSSIRAMFNHGQSPPFKRLSHKANLSVDDIGVWAETILDERNEYEAFLLNLASSGKMGWSSATAGHLIERQQVEKANFIKSWPIVEASLTHTPAEPRNQAIPLKSLGELLPPIPQPEAESGDGEEGGEQLSDHQSTTEVKTMDITQEALQEMLNQASAQAVKSAFDALPQVNKTEVVVVKDEADQPFERAGDFFKAVKNSALYPQATDVRLKSLKASGLSEGVPADGGYLIPTQWSAGIFDKMLDVNKILSRVSMDMIAGNTMVYRGVDESTRVGSVHGGIVGYWMAEAGTKTSSKPQFYSLELKLKKIAALCYATDEQLEDTPALESWLLRTVPDVLRWYVEEAIINGTGVGQPTGILNAPALNTILRTDASKVLVDDVANMWSRRWPGYSDYVWLVNPTVSAQLNIMTASTAPVYMPAGNVAGSPFGTLYGAPVIETEHCQAMGTAGDILLVSLSQYQAIGKAGGVQSASSIHVQFTTDETAFRFVYRFDGAPLWNSTLTPVHGSALSPFVSMSAASS